MKRKASLVEAGLEEEEAEEAVASYEEFDDATFEAILAMLKMAKYEEEEGRRRRTKKKKKKRSS